MQATLNLVLQEKRKSDERTARAFERYFAEHPEASYHEAAMHVMGHSTEQHKKKDRSAQRRRAIEAAPAMRASDEAMIAAQEERAERIAIQSEPDP